MYFEPFFLLRIVVGMFFIRKLILVEYEQFCMCMYIQLTYNSLTNHTHTDLLLSNFQQMYMYVHACIPKDRCTSSSTHCSTATIIYNVYTCIYMYVNESPGCVLFTRVLCVGFPALSHREVLFGDKPEDARPGNGVTQPKTSPRRRHQFPENGRVFP